MTTNMLDTIHANVHNLPSAKVAGYVTGSEIIKWTDADFAEFPDAVRINQTNGSDPLLGNVLDIEDHANCAGSDRAAKVRHEVEAERLTCMSMDPTFKRLLRVLRLSASRLISGTPILTSAWLRQLPS